MYPLILLLWVVLVGAYINGPVGDPDLWWHITIGRWIVAHHELPSTDLWNAFSTGEPWRAYSWLHEVLFAIVDRMGGGNGLWVLQLALAIALVGCLVAVFGILSRDLFFGTFLGSVAAVGCFQNFSLRPQTFAWIFFALGLLVAEKIRRDGFSFRRGCWLGLLFCLWANSHVTTVLGVAAVFLWIMQRDTGVRASVAAAIALVATLLTPYGGGEWLALLAQSDHPLTMVSITEFQSATILSFGAGILVLLAALLIASFARHPDLFRPGQLILTTALVCGGAAIVKFLPFAVIALAALLAAAWPSLRGRESGKTSGIVEGIERLRTACAWLPALGSAALLFAVVVVVVSRSAQEPLNKNLIPVAAVDYIQSRNLDAPLLNDFGRGGYVMYRMSDARGELAPEWKVPLDGRTNVNSPQIWKAYRRAMEGTDGWRELLTLVNPRTILWRRESPFVELLKMTGEWDEVFSSGSAARGFVVLSRR